MEKILSIKFDDNFKIEENGYYNYEGYIITTDLQTIKVGITNYQSCCEHWGILISEDNIKEFINSNLLGIKIVDEALNSKVLEETEDTYEGGAMFINFETTNGLFQITAYNKHNGYYSHNAVVISKQLNYSENL